MKRFSTLLGRVFTLFVLMSTVQVQGQINTPRTSPRATVSQTVGISTVTIDYSRPRVRGRAIYGTPLAHYGFKNLGFGPSETAPWRAGADENTMITFSHDAKIEGKEVKAGTYGLHLALTEGNTATLILSHNSSSWGSYFYDKSEDALRVEINVKTIPNTELLTFDFESATATSTTAALRWEKKAFPFNIEFNVSDIVMADISDKLRDQTGFNRQAWEQAAQYALSNGDTKKALKWIENAQSGWFFSQKTFANTQIKAAILSQMGKTAEASKTMDEVLDIATVLEMHGYGRQLIAASNKDKALEIFKLNADKNKGVWPTHYGLARGYSAKGDFKSAIKHIKKALVNAPNDASKSRVQANWDKLKKGEDIN